MYRRFIEQDSQDEVKLMSRLYEINKSVNADIGIKFTDILIGTQT